MAGAEDGGVSGTSGRWRATAPVLLTRRAVTGSIGARRVRCLTACWGCAGT
jgi:hypothetical protein